MPHHDPIIDEIHRHRQAYVESFGGDREAMYADIYRKQEELKKQGYRFVTLPPRRLPSPAPLPETPPSPSAPDSMVGR